jgi:hypothetical protein
MECAVTAESPPSREELAGEIDNLFRAAHQSALFVYWKLVERPITHSFEQHGIPQAHTYFENGIAESALLFIRKTTEFFKPRGDRDRPDSLYAYRYLDDWAGTWVVPKETYIELHKRIGHITVRDTRHGKLRWQIIDFTVKAVDQWIAFFSLLGGSALFNGDPPKGKLKDFVSSLREVSRACHLLQTGAKT